MKAGETIFWDPSPAVKIKGTYTPFLGGLGTQELRSSTDLSTDQPLPSFPGSVVLKWCLPGGACQVPGLP